MAENIRERTSIVVSLGDCAVNGNVTGLRNPLDCAKILRCCYGEGKAPQAAASRELFSRVMPLHQVIRVDVFIPGCPPEPAVIMNELEKILMVG
jgi:NAD-reducing hydrogenase small subunit